ncbi:tetratricopeptide repeat protein [Luminiphilus sp.]|nr:tetratricopeptide repeat protein [Luminiphilus sp.]MDB4048724.1 tetratricopeptide repeat protein [Luminiphilus sp.]
MRTHFIALLLFSLVLSSLVGCASPANNGTPAPSRAEESVATEVTQEANDLEKAPEPPETPIPAASVLPLLTAEFALRARDFDLGSSLLTEQAMVLSDPELARRALRLAEFVSDEQRAAALSLRLAELDPDDGAAAAAASGWLARSGQPLKALDYAAIALERGVSVNVAGNLGSFSQFDEDTQLAIAAAIESLSSRWPDDDEVAIAATLLARLQQDWPRAESLILPVLRRSPNDVRSIMLWTQLQIDQSVEDPLERLVDAIADYPENTELRLQYARLLGAEGDYSGARAQFAILLELEPNNPDMISTAALLDFELELYDAALAKFLQLIALEARLDEAFYYVGRIQAADDRYSEAIEAFGSVGPSREFRDAKVRAAQVLIDTAFASDIRQFFDAQRRTYPSSAEQLFLLEAESLRDWSGESLEAYDRGLAAFPQSFSLLYGRAMIHESEGSLWAMEQDLRRILAQDPNHAATLNALGYSLTNRTQRYEEAAVLIERALALSPGDPAIMDSLGWVYYKLGQYVQSESLLREAHAALPDPEVAAHLGEVLWAQGREVEAKDVWQEGLNRVSDHPIILEAIDRLGVALP